MEIPMFIRKKGIAGLLAGSLLLSLPVATFAHSGGAADSGSIESEFVGPSYEKSAHPLSEVSFTIIHDTHFHGNFGDPEAPNNIANYFGIANKIKAEQPDSLFIGNGDDLGTSVLSSVFQGMPIVDAFNAGKLDVDTFGNHDFDMGPDQLTKLVEASEFPWVSANVVDKRTGDVFAKEAGAERFIIKKVGGVNIGITGLINEEAPEITSMGENATVLDPVEAMKTIVPEMQAAGAQFIIVSSHLASPDARIVAEEVDGIDLIVGDHAAFAYDSPEKIHDTLLWFVGDEFNYLGEINFYFQDGEITDFNYHRYDLKMDVEKEGYLPDAKVKAVMDSYIEQLGSELNVQIGSTKSELDVMKASQRVGETAFGDLVADVMKVYTDSDIALVNGGGIRAERIFSIGPLTKKDIMDALPFTNYVIKLEITGDQLYSALENGVSQIEKVAGRFPQVSGIQFAYNPELPAGARIVDVAVNGKPLERNALYTIATLDFLAGGGDGYDMFKESKVLLDKNAGPLLSQAVIDYIQGKGSIDPKVEGRITVSDIVPDNFYSDIAGLSYESVLAVVYLQNKGVRIGADDGNQFFPQAKITAGEFVQSAVDAVGLSDSVSSALLAEIVNAGLKTDAELTREQMAMLLSELLTLTDKQPAENEEAIESLNTFADADTVTETSENAWAAAVYTGLVRGKVDSKGTLYLSPNDVVTRVQAAIVIHRLLRL